jgi:hypothetical protein
MCCAYCSKYSAHILRIFWPCSQRISPWVYCGHPGPGRKVQCVFESESRIVCGGRAYESGEQLAEPGSAEFWDDVLVCICPFFTFIIISYIYQYINMYIIVLSYINSNLFIHPIQNGDYFVCKESCFLYEKFLKNVACDWLINYLGSMTLIR